MGQPVWLAIADRHTSSGPRPKSRNVTAKTVTHPTTDDSFIVVKIGQRQIRALLDTGSYASLISDKLAKALRLQFLPSQMSTADRP